MSSVSGGVAGVEPDGVDTDSGGVGVTLGVGRPNSDYLEFIEESFWAFEVFEPKLSLRITSIIEDIFKSIKCIFYLLFISLLKFLILRNLINLI